MGSSSATTGRIVEHGGGYAIETTEHRSWENGNHVGGGSTDQTTIYPLSGLHEHVLGHLQRALKAMTPADRSKKVALICNVEKSLNQLTQGQP